MFNRRRFPVDIILVCVRWYCKYGISYRDLAEMMQERGVDVDPFTIMRWVHRYAPELEKRVRWYQGTVRPSTGSRARAFMSTCTSQARSFSTVQHSMNSSIVLIRCASCASIDRRS